MGWIQTIKLRSENSIGWKNSAFLSVHLAFEKAREERSYERFGFHTPKNKFFFQKHSKSKRQTHFFKNDKNLLFCGGLFQRVLLT